MVMCCFVARCLFLSLIAIYVSIAAVAVFLDYLLQITAFVALVTLDFRRSESGYVDCIPCLSAGAEEIDDIPYGKSF